ncbi:MULTISPECIES: hypothetical protein [unclassified Polaromonas]|uniref:hypothetical protein n=1 Tax=unclassified Polaromonas TaxID=2638319 RepID=UPI000F09659C|nr:MULTISPECIES: hypothetical protein [unclassified Polaromonas]AYQ26903.1 hypothetical protein DT070_01945 [Polaromonas sp. SP1]QGJ18250.1 hypothetical protein F7R28_07485 [Polaromonas sp. Pch-P]
MEEKKLADRIDGSSLNSAVLVAAQLVKEIPDSSYEMSKDPFLLARAKAVNIGHLASAIVETIQSRMDGPLPEYHKLPGDCGFYCRKPAKS